MRMHLYTSYRMLANAGLERSDMLFRELSASIGGPREYGHQRPIGLAMMMGIDGCGPRDVLWSLGAVYPEQASAAGRVARSVAILACKLGMDRFRQKNPLLTKALGTAVDYSIGEADADELTSVRRRVLPASSKIVSPYHHVFTLAWIACAAPDRMHRVAGGTVEALKLAMPMEGVCRDAKSKLLANAERAIRDELSRSLSRDEADVTPGPGEFFPPKQMNPAYRTVPRYRIEEFDPLQDSLDLVFGVGA